MAEEATAPKPNEEASGLLDDAKIEAPIDDASNTEETAVKHLAQDEEIGERPDWCPEKFWGDAGVNSETLAKSYSELEGKFRAGKHKAPDGDYDLTIAKEHKVPDDDPVLQTYVAWAKDAGISQEHFDQLASGVLKNGVDQAEVDVLSRDQEMASLGTNAQAVIDDQVDWARRLVEAKAWGADDFEEFKVWGGTANGIRAIQKLRRYMGDVTKIPVQVNPQADSLPSKDECYEMVKDPEYQKSPAFRRKVDKIFAQVFGTHADEKVML